MKKAKFNYRKKDDSTKERILLSPIFVKESYNKFTDIDNDKVNYVQGYEIDKEKVSEEEIKLYEEAIRDYYDLAVPTMDEFLSENNLDPKKVQFKTFKKDGVEGLKIL